MSDTVNRQILLVEKPTGKLGPEHFKMVNGTVPEPEGIGEVLVKARYISLDAANRAWMHGATYRAAVEANTVMAGGGIAEVVSSKAPRACAGRHRVQATPAGRITPRCRPSISNKMPRMEPMTHLLSVYGIAGLTAYFGLLACRQAQGRRDRRGVRRGRLGRVDRRPDRQDQGLPRHRHRRRQGQVPLADERTRLRRRGRLQGRRAPSRRCGRQRRRASTSISTMSAATFSKPVLR